MTLDRLIITNYKNYQEADIELCPRINGFVGNNGVGKTNLLDAVYALSFCKSCFNPVDSQNIRIGADFYALHGHYGSDLASLTFKMGGAKQMKWNKKTYKTLSEHIGKIPLVIISPADQNIITGGSDLRRKFIDGVISQTDKTFLDSLIHYNKALEQRNRLLKRMWEDRQWDEAIVSVWDDQLCRHGENIYDKRRSFMVEFIPLFQESYRWLAPNDTLPQLAYHHDERPLSMQLADSRQADRYAQYTTHGPHKDDIEASLGDGMSIKRFGSQGQQKSVALSLKLAQYQYLYRQRAIKPILLLDDIFDKLDLQRVEQLLSLVAGDNFGQVLLTDTQPARLKDILSRMPQADHLLYSVEKGGTIARG